METRTFAIIGLGPIGCAAGALAWRRGLQLVAAVDRDPHLAGRDPGELLGTGPTGLRVTPDLESALERAQPRLALHATSSRLRDALPQLEPCVERGIHVVSSCEELAYPWRTQPELARRLDTAARAGGAVVLGSGVNPGFVMDKLVVTVLAACAQVEHVAVRRRLNAATRRRPFQDKVGVGMTREEFDEASRRGRIGHVGFPESAHLVADAIGAPAARDLDEHLEPLVAGARTIAGDRLIEAGRVLGIRQRLVLRAGGRECVRLELEAYAGADSEDAIRVAGEPSLDLRFVGGMSGDVATAARLANDLLQIEGLQPGLRTLLDLPIRYHKPQRGDRK